MPWLVKTLIVFPIFYILAGCDYLKLWKSGLIGVGVMLVFDTIGYKLNLYIYRNGLIMLGGFIPLLHIFNINFISILYVKWLPSKWDKRILYIIYVSAIFLAMEAAMYSVGGIVYPKWKLLYSYFLDIVGLSLLAYLSDFVINRNKQIFNTKY